MATISYYVKPTSEDYLLIMAKFQDGLKRHYKSTERKIPANKSKDEYRFWDKKKKRARIHEESSNINDLLTDWETRFTIYKKNCKAERRAVDVPTFIRSLEYPDGDIHQPLSTTILADVYAEFLKFIKPITSDKNYRMCKVVYTQLIKFQVHKKATFLLNDINSEFFTSFGLYLIQEEGNLNNSVRRKITRIKTVMNYAFRKGYIKTKTYDVKHDFKGTPSRKVSLLPDELEQIKKLNLDDKFQAMVLDAFILACLVGLRHSDAMLIAPMHFNKIKVDNSEMIILDLTQVKGTKQNTIPITLEAYEIAKKYFTADASTPLFGEFKSQAFSRSLKDIFTEAKLNRLCEVIESKNTQVTRKAVPLHDIISFHCGRNTYITSLLAKGLPAVYVKENAGHSDIRTTMGYSKQDDMARWLETIKMQEDNPAKKKTSPRKGRSL